MKRLLIILALMVTPAFAITVTVDGEQLPSSPAPLLSSGRVLVPLRSVFQALNATVDYRNSTITAVRGDNRVQLRPNTTSATVNGERVFLDTPARLTNGTTYVPLRFVAQALGEQVGWNSATKTVVIGETVEGASSPVSSDTGSRSLAPSLKRLVVGNQGGILKVLEPSGTGVAYYRGLDDRSVAPLSEEDQSKILASLGFSEDHDAIAHQVMSEFPQLPQKEAIAVLGLFNSLPEQKLSPGTGKSVRTFLVETMENDKSVYNRRQAVLSLAVGSQVEPNVVDSVLAFYRSSENLWETFPVQQFFEYQSSRLHQMPTFPTWRQEALSVNSLYRENIASYLY